SREQLAASRAPTQRRPMRFGSSTPPRDPSSRDRDCLLQDRDLAPRPAIFARPPAPRKRNGADQLKSYTYDKRSLFRIAYGNLPSSFRSGSPLSWNPRNTGLRMVKKRRDVRSSAS